jgi:hypothetical protein
VGALGHAERVGLHAADEFFGQLLQQHQTVFAHHEVVVVGIVVGSEERQRVELSFAEPIWRVPAPVLLIARGGEEGQQHDHHQPEGCS